MSIKIQLHAGRRRRSQYNHLHWHYLGDDSDISDYIDGEETIV